MPIDLSEDYDDEVPTATQAGEARALSTFVLYGATKNKIVGCRYYHGYATIGEMVMIRREPQNQYDRNAIQVLNVQGVQIGHIPKQMAAKLAKYMDQRKLLVEGQIAGEKGYYECPLMLSFYGSNDPDEQAALVAEMTADKLDLKELKKRAKGRQGYAKTAAGKYSIESLNSVLARLYFVAWSCSVSRYL